MTSLRELPGLNMNGTYSPRPSTSNMDTLRNEYNTIMDGERRRHEFVEVRSHASPVKRNHLLTDVESNDHYSKPDF